MGNPQKKWTDAKLSRSDDSGDDRQDVVERAAWRAVGLVLGILGGAVAVIAGLVEILKAVLG